MKKFAVSTPRRILFITLLLPLVFSLAGCGEKKSSVFPQVNKENCENNPRLLDSLDEATKKDFQEACIDAAATELLFRTKDFNTKPNSREPGTL